jgi:hypothetical protein
VLQVAENQLTAEVVEAGQDSISGTGLWYRNNTTVSPENFAFGKILLDQAAYLSYNDGR